MRLANRVFRLEAIHGRRPDVTWPEVNAAHERLRTYLIAKVRAAIDGTGAPVQDPEATERDALLMRLWRKQQGTWVHEESDGVRDRLLQKLARWDVGVERAQAGAP
jgi:hypothetical protein